MNKSIFRHAWRLTWLPCLMALALGSSAQLQYIPSVWLRGWMNELAPGCVDAAGYLDPDHPALDTVRTATCSTNTLDLTGIQFLHHLKDLTIYCPGEGVVTPILPDSLERLTLGGFGFTGPISIPDGLVSLYAYWSGEIIGAIPPTLDTLLLHSSNSAFDVTLMPLPEGLMFLELVTSSQIIGLTSIPASLRHLRIITNSTLCLPILPMEMDHLELSWGAVQCLPNLPLVEDPDHLLLPQSLQFCDPYDECLYSNALGGSIWLDDDGNGMQGPGEAPLAGDAVLLDLNDLVGVTPEGYWMRYATEGNHTVTAMPFSPYATAIAPATQTATLSSSDPVVILPGFSYQLIPDITDVAIDITTTRLVTGQSANLSMTLRNLGSVSASGLATVNVDPNLSITTINPTPLSVSSNSVTWDMEDVPVGGHGTWTITADVPFMPIGSMLTFTGAVTTNLADSDLDNNSTTWIDQVLAPYDPNDKLVHPSTATPSEMVDGIELDYTIRFQNTGNYPASRVVITDTLSSDLLAASMRYVSSSHPCSWWVVDGVLTFRFDPIYLPDSSADLAGSQGFVKFKINTQEGLPANHQIHNAAHIFFDINPPIHTPPSLFEVVDDQTGMQALRVAGIHIGPNPAADQLNIWLNANWGGTALASVTDALGRRLITRTAQAGPTVIDLSGLVSGPLLISVTNAEHHHVAKVLKL